MVRCGQSNNRAPRPHTYKSVSSPDHVPSMTFGCDLEKSVIRHLLGVCEVKQPACTDYTVAILGHHVDCVVGAQMKHHLVLPISFLLIGLSYHDNGVPRNPVRDTPSSFFPMI